MHYPFFEYVETVKFIDIAVILPMLKENTKTENFIPLKAQTSSFESVSFWMQHLATRKRKQIKNLGILP